MSSSSPNELPPSTHLPIKHVYLHKCICLSLRFSKPKNTAVDHHPKLALPVFLSSPRDTTFPRVTLDFCLPTPLLPWDTRSWVPLTGKPMPSPTTRHSTPLHCLNYICLLPIGVCHRAESHLWTRNQTWSLPWLPIKLRINSVLLSRRYYHLLLF